MVLRDLAERLGCSVPGDTSVQVHRVAGIEDSGPGDLTFVANSKYVPYLSTTRASAVILAPELQMPLPSIVSATPYLAYARAATILHPLPRPRPGVHPSAWLSNALVESVNTKIRLLTHVAFGVHSAEPLIGLAMLALGGLCPQLPGRE